MNRRGIVLITLCSLLGVSGAIASGIFPIIYVRSAATGANDGSSWADAYTNLQSALTDARITGGPRQIWVAGGVYHPAPSQGDRGASFELVVGVEILGGFSGSETSAEERFLNLRPTVLSGDLDGNDDEGIDDSNCCVGRSSAGCDLPECELAVCAADSYCCNVNWDRTCVLLTECLCGNLCGTKCDNSYHVVSSRLVPATGRLDGFIITGGNANGPTLETRRGGGLAVDGGGPTISRCIFGDNRAEAFGGAIYQNGSTQVVNSRFLGNFANAGGAVYNDGGAPLFVNSLFSGNAAMETGGGAMLNHGADPTIANCTFSENSAGTAGGVRNQLASSDPVIFNSIFWHNRDVTGTGEFAQIRSDPMSDPQIEYCIVEGIPTDGQGTNRGIDPFFVDAVGPDGRAGTLDDDLRLQVESPAIDAGNNDHVPPDVADLDGDGNSAEATPRDLEEKFRFFDDPDTPNTGNGLSPFVDLGPFEVASDCNKNGIVDDKDVLNHTSNDCNGNNIPDECEIAESSTAPGGPFFCTVDCARDCDQDGVPDSCQTDKDNDGVIDACDDCPGTAAGIPVDTDGCSLPGGCCFVGGACGNVSDATCALLGGAFLGYGLSCQSDPDGDGVRGCADQCPDDGQKSRPGVCGCGVPDTDTDRDHLPDCVDRCPFDNPDDTDGDGFCDSQDPCPDDPTGDTDGDGVCDSDDRCPFDNPDDPDADGVCTVNDGCPMDPMKQAPGICGCGVADTDSDTDGVADCRDECANTPRFTVVDDVGCPAIGACCFAIGACIDDLSRPDCRSIPNGVYQGHQTNCDDGCAFPGDLDRDGDVDLTDHDLFIACLSGPLLTTSGESRRLLADFDGNDLIDLRDIAGFQTSFTGPG